MAPRARGDAPRLGRALVTGLWAAALVALTPGWLRAEVACDPPAGFVPRERLQSSGVVVLFKTQPATIQIGQHFAVEAVVCADATAPVTALRVDADMPEHRHGMNYRPTVAARGPGRYVAEGLLFHMPGQWRFLFDVERGARTERLTSELEVE